MYVVVPVTVPALPYAMSLGKLGSEALSRMSENLLLCF